MFCSGGGIVCVGGCKKRKTVSSVWITPVPTFTPLTHSEPSHPLSNPTQTSSQPLITKFMSHHPIADNAHTTQTTIVHKLGTPKPCTAARHCATPRADRRLAPPRAAERLRALPDAAARRRNTRETLTSTTVLNVNSYEQRHHMLRGKPLSSQHTEA